MVAYFEANTVDEDAVNNYASWTADELADLRDSWRFEPLREIAVHLGRTEAACMRQYHYQRSRPAAQRWQPPEKHQRAMAGEYRSPRADGPVRTIHDDEEKWWEADYYRPQSQVS